LIAEEGQPVGTLSCWSNSLWIEILAVAYSRPILLSPRTALPTHSENIGAKQHLYTTQSNNRLI